MTDDSHRMLDEIASVKRDKEMEVTRLHTEFRNEKEALLDKS